MKTTNSTTGEQEVKSLHTLGEWIPCSGDAGQKINIECEGYGNDGMPIATLKGIDRKANAAHIVKCVNAHDELVKALLDLIKVSETTTQNLVGFDGAYELDSSIDRARDILAKL